MYSGTTAEAILGLFLGFFHPGSFVSYQKWYFGNSLTAENPMKTERSGEAGNGCCGNRTCHTQGRDPLSAPMTSFSWLHVESLGLGHGAWPSEGCTDSPMLLFSSRPQFLALLFSMESFNLSDVDIFPYTKGSGLQRAQLPGWCLRGTMAIVRRHIQGLSTGEGPRVLGSLCMASDAVRSISSLPFSYCWKLPWNWKEPLSGLFQRGVCKKKNCWTLSK